jgi:hypothetical protein
VPPAVAGGLEATNTPLGGGVNADDRGYRSSFPHANDSTVVFDHTKGEPKP